MSSDYIDISQPMRSSTPVWPGDTPFSIEETWTISNECPVRVSRITMSTHTGTHADAHSHYDESGEDAASRNLAPYLGRCIVVEAMEGSGAVTFDEIAPALETIGAHPERVLLRTFRDFPVAHWPDSFRAVSPTLIQQLAESGCRLIGTDAPSIDPQESKTLDAHHAIHRNDMAILEGLVLQQVAPGEYDLIALPLRIDNADASPVRAVLRPLDRD